MELTQKLESVLFVSSKPLTTEQLARFVNTAEPEVESALTALAEQKKHDGIVLLNVNGYWQLATHPENVELVKGFLNADLREKLTDATVEVLGIIAYRQPISKAEIESIRGVNSQYSIRQLLMRGLIEKVANPNDSRSSLYQVTTEFVQHLGIQSVQDLPEFEKLTASIKLPETPQAQPETNSTPQSEMRTPQPQTYQDPVGNVPVAPLTEPQPAPQPAEYSTTHSQPNPDTTTDFTEDVEEEFIDDDDDFNDEED